MTTSVTKTLKCQKCKTKIKVIVDPVPKEIICPTCECKLKLVKHPMMYAYSLNPTSPRKEMYRYELQKVDLGAL